MTEVRAALLKDVDELHALGSGVSEFSVSRETVTFWPKKTLRRAIESGDVFIRVAQDKDRLVGFIIASFSDGLKKAIIENIFVSPTHRGKKLGNDLLNRLLQDLRNCGCEYVATLIPQDAFGALSTYKDAGFTEGEVFVWLDRPLASSFKSS
ncbi:MAG: family N-acetyltransferase [Candidatus Saccharibacteria bacterium]|nr:family N-acetyltransferase [Candidatus Saccharibacteria bacterium]